MMPKKDGYQACKEIRQIKNTPFIMLSARGEEYDKLIGFDLGIDDYVTKPFSPKELVARVKAVLKRANNEESIMRFDGLVIDDKAHDVFVDEKKINLTPKEYDLLKYLVANKKKKNGYKTSIELSKKYNLYRQNYCGCVYSKREKK